MKKIIFLFALTMLISGCATISEQRAITEDIGKTREYKQPYKEVFSACESTLEYLGMQIRESNYEEGYIYAYSGYVTTMVLVKKKDEEHTIVQYRGFWGSNYLDIAFFNRVTDLLVRGGTAE